MTERLNALKTVRCYFFPEVVPIVNAVETTLSKPEARNLLLTQTPVAEAREIIKPLNFNPELEVPATQEGKVDLDMIHEPILDRVVDAYSQAAPGLREYRWRYPTMGSSEGIFHLLSKLKREGVNEIFVPGGEYEGYQEYGKSIGIATTEIDLENTDPKNIKPGVWFISNPSARNGNIIPNAVINSYCEAGHKVILDLAYIGSTEDYIFDVSHPNIQTVLLSWSKPYGLFWFRIGATFSRTPIDSLYASKWFKDIRRILLGLKVAEEIGPHKLHPVYKSLHKKIITQINTDTGLEMRKSNALLLGYLTEEDVAKLNPEQKAMIQKYARGKGYRFCIEPYYEMAEKAEGKSTR